MLAGAWHRLHLRRRLQMSQGYRASKTPPPSCLGLCMCSLLSSTADTLVNFTKWMQRNPEILKGILTRSSVGLRGKKLLNPPPTTTLLVVITTKTIMCLTDDDDDDEGGGAEEVEEGLKGSLWWEPQTRGGGRTSREGERFPFCLTRHCVASHFYP